MASSIMVRKTEKNFDLMNEFKKIINEGTREYKNET